jgi:hypothetical protein
MTEPREHSAEQAVPAGVGQASRVLIVGRGESASIAARALRAAGLTAATLFRTEFPDDETGAVEQALAELARSGAPRRPDVVIAADGDLAAAEPYVRSGGVLGALVAPETMPTFVRLVQRELRIVPWVP